jgi:hypothetical protein
MEDAQKYYYNGKQLKVLFKYESGYWEMVENTGVKNVVLIHKDELKTKNN